MSKYDLHIDGKSVADTYDAYVLADSYTSILSYPSIKSASVTSTDWGDENGIEVDLTGLALDSRKLTLSFYFKDKAKMQGIIAMLKSKVYHTFYFNTIEKGYKLRMLSHSDLNLWDGKQGTTKIEFADDFPLWEYTETAPVGGAVIQSDIFKLDGTSFSSYGVAMLQGTVESIAKTAEVKSNLTIDIANQNGLIYDNGHSVLTKEKEVTLKCFIHERAEDFVTNYDALLYQLSKPMEHTIYCEGLLDESACYYKSSKVTQFCVGHDRKIWCVFDLDLVLTT